MAQTLKSLQLHKNRLRNAGYKLTHARLTVLNTIMGLGGHVTSSEVLDAVNTSDESTGRASVFRALDVFTQLGLIRPTYIESSMTPHYVIMPDGHHHHIICTNCNRVIEFDDCGLGELTEQLQQRFNLEITGHLLEFYAQCAHCAIDTQQD